MVTALAGESGSKEALNTSNHSGYSLSFNGTTASNWSHSQLWSVSVYDCQGRPFSNPLNRSALNTWNISDPTDPNTTAALANSTVYIQTESPGADLEHVWLPVANDSTFQVLLRVYDPVQELREGWEPPALVRYNASELTQAAGNQSSPTNTSETATGADGEGSEPAEEEDSEALGEDEQPPEEVEDEEDVAEGIEGEEEDTAVEDGEEAEGQSATREPENGPVDTRPFAPQPRDEE